MMTAEYQFRFSERHLLQALDRYRGTLWWVRPYRAVKWVVVAVLVAMAAVFFVMQLIFFGVIVCSLLGALVLGAPIDRWIARRRFRKSPFHDADLIFRLCDDEIQVRADRRSASQMRRNHEGKAISRRIPLVSGSARGELAT